VETKLSEKRKDRMMSRFEDTEAALTERLRAMKAKPEMTINLFDISVHLNGAGYSQDEIMEVMFALEQDKVIALTTGNRVLMLKALPE
jgi:N-acetylmuramoyl-L-alanine amidase